MSQHFDLGPGFFFMLCRIFLNDFFTFIYVNCHKNKIKNYIKN